MSRPTAELVSKAREHPFRADALRPVQYESIGWLRKSDAVITIDETLERTPAGIPVSLRPLFQKYVPENLDPDRSAFTVIERTLAWGDLPEPRWLFARYGRERLAEWVRQAGWRCLPRRRLRYWVSFFRLDDYRHGERI